MPKPSSQLIVFTDLDGTLLDHHSYSWEPARAALQALKEAGIPLILNSSKTVAEIQELREELGNQDPYVVENGSAIAIPRGYFCQREQAPGDPEIVCFGAGYAEIRERLERLREESGFQFVGFGDLSVAEVAGLTGLDNEAAARAKQRASSEPLLWQNGPAQLESFRHRLEDDGLNLTQGGRFLHVSAAGSKGAAVSWLKQAYADEHEGVAVVTIGLGDGPNDLPMLEAVDYPVMIRAHHDLPMPLENRSRLILTDGYGPEGWNQAILELLERLT